MLRDLNPEDLFVSDGTHRGINHELLRSFGFFNLNREVQEEIMDIYVKNALNKGEKDKYKMLTFRALSKNIQNFPFSVYQHFTSGQAYEYNMDWLEKYAE
ncbi:MAG: hypothetical protein CSA81_12020 [Acidobacteria bacterium]|nr:MAG: hypothetical protein CSA81_12020 [Acidobacteriota bacterium]